MTAAQSNSRYQFEEGLSIYWWALSFYPHTCHPEPTCHPELAEGSQSARKDLRSFDKLRMTEDKLSMTEIELRMTPREI
jgi:hypothetical protein